MATVNDNESTTAVSESVAGKNIGSLSSTTIIVPPHEDSLFLSLGAITLGEPSRDLIVIEFISAQRCILFTIELVDHSLKKCFLSI